ncbi:MAG: hypothetical protein KF682_16045 [Nitrospira sp.]|nr:hypothetical protein [Nitrospira sp.]
MAAVQYKPPAMNRRQASTPNRATAYDRKWASSSDQACRWTGSGPAGAGESLDAGRGTRIRGKNLNGYAINIGVEKVSDGVEGN